MREMKAIGVDWIGEIPVNWEVVRVKHQFQNKKEIAGDSSDKYQRLSLTLNGVLKKSKDDNEGLQPEKFDGYQILRENELVFKLIDLENTKTSRVGWSPYEGLVSPAYIKLNCSGDSRFGYYYFLSMWHRNIFNSLADDGVRSALNARDLLDLPYILPAEEERVKIVRYLDLQSANIDNVIAKTTESIEEYKRLKQSIITEAVTKGLNPEAKMKDSGIEWIGEIPQAWEVGQLKHFGEAIIGLTYAPEDVVDEGAFVLRSSNVQEGTIDLSDRVCVNLDVKEKLLLKKNDILICSRNGSRSLIGKCALIDEQAEGKTFGAFMTVFRGDFNPYVYYVLNSSIFSFHIGTFLTATINQLTTSNLNSIKIPMPPKEEQEAIAEFLKQKTQNIDSLIKKKRDLKCELESYKKSLIYECVTGKREVM